MYIKLSTVQLHCVSCTCVHVPLEVNWHICGVYQSVVWYALLSKLLQCCCIEHNSIA